MQGPTDERRRGSNLWMVERAIVLQVLRDDHEERWSRARAGARRSLTSSRRRSTRRSRACEQDGVLHQERAGVGHRAPRGAWTSSS